MAFFTHLCSNGFLVFISILLQNFKLIFCKKI